MCLLAIAWKVHPRYPLIFAGNRDEFHERPARAAHWWADAPQVFGGRDLEAGGAWLGVRRDGRFAVVTNFREPDRRPEDLRSRGELPLRFLAEPISASEYRDLLQRERDQYAGFNLLFGDPLRDAMYYFSNRAKQAVSLAPGVHALSNHLLDTPWPKVRRLRERFDLEVARGAPSAERLLEMLADTTPAAEHELPNSGVSRDWERLLSPARIVSSVYGTRASTVVMIDASGQILFHERSFAPDGSVSGEVTQRFGGPVDE